MDQKILKYKTILRELVLEIDGIPSSRGPNELDSLAIVDDERGVYVIQHMGWINGRRDDNPVVFLRIKDGKVWLEVDMTDLGVADRLVEAGIPKSDIVLGFHPPKMRQYTEFAVA